MSLLKTLYKPNLNLLTDLYQITMAYAYWKEGSHEKESVFHLFFRKNPFKGNYAITCGLEPVVNFLRDYHFDQESLDYLKTLKGADDEALFETAFLDYLSLLRFDCDIDAIPEGMVVFPHEPLIRVKGPLIQAQLLETTLLTLVNFASLIATKSARINQAAEGDTVLEFGLRRAQGVDGGLTASRAAYIGGCQATSNVLAGKLYGIPVKGTHAHSWVMAHEDEEEAFNVYAEAMPNNCIFLVDTYDTVEGVKKAIEVGKKLRKQGHEMLGVRLDSGDLADLSIKARKLLDDAGFPEAKVVASNDLDEYNIKKLKDKGATISVWGIGTRLVTAYDQPSLGGVYKLAALRGNDGEWDYKVKLSEQEIKVSNPGVLQVKRFYENGIPIGDMIVNEAATSSVNLSSFSGEQISFKNATAENLLVPIFVRGKQVYKLPDIHSLRKNTLNQLKLFKAANLENYPSGLEENLLQEKKRIISALKHV